MEYSHGGDRYGNQNIRLDYSVNTNPLGMPESVKLAAVNAVAQCSQYPDAECRSLKAEISRVYGVREEWIVCGNGAAELIFCLVQAEKPKRALVLAPTFSEYENALGSVGCRVDYCQLKREQEFAVDEKLLSCLTPELDMVFLCNPNNPTGKVIGRELMEKTLTACEKYGILLVVDECFMEFVDGGVEISLTDQVGKHKNLFLLKACTKSFAMAGIRLGYGFSSDGNLLKEMEKTRQPWSVSLIAQEAGKAAMGEYGFLEKTREALKTERTFLTEALRQLGFSVFATRANYLLFHWDEDGNEDGSLYRKSLRYGILIRDCSNYRGLLKGDYRICIGRHEDNRELLGIFKKIIEEKR